jgi:hypothetical protein
MQGSTTEPVPGPIDTPAPEYDENGVDRTLIRSSLRKTPTECLQILDDLHSLAQSTHRVRKPVR